MKKKYSINISRKKLQPYWREFCVVHNTFYKMIGRIERRMSKELDIKDMEFIHTDMGWCGIGNADRTMKLEQFDPE